MSESGVTEDGQQAAGPPATRALSVFISYRRGETPGEARLLHDALAERYGADHVFRDISDIPPGANFVRTIADRVRACDVLIALIGRRWSEITHKREERTRLEHTEDWARVEIETAISRGSGVQIIPALIDDAQIPNPMELPRSIRPITEINAAPLRHTRWDDDVARLIERLDGIARATVPRQDPPSLPGVERRTPLEPLRSLSDVELPNTEELAGHLDELVQLIAEDGTVVPFLGPGVNAGDRTEPWREGCHYLPDSDELAGHLAEKFSFESPVGAHLAGVAQYVFHAKGRHDLYRTLKRALSSDAPPGSIHRFLAGLPGILERAGRPPKYQMIVTTNFDDALERAFDEVNEPYDLAVYMASGEHAGKFLHDPYDDAPCVIANPNDYVAFPFDDSFELDRTVIVKIHGAVDKLTTGVEWRDNYVVTEDNYIDYLSGSPVDQLVPRDLLTKLRESHALFLGYGMRDWSLRVILQRIWRDRRLDRSWAIQRDPDRLDRVFWRDFGVALYSMPLCDYVQELEDRLAKLAEKSSGP